MYIFEINKQVVNESIYITKDNIKIISTSDFDKNKHYSITPLYTLSDNSVVYAFLEPFYIFKHYKNVYRNKQTAVPSVIFVNPCIEYSNYLFINDFDNFIQQNMDIINHNKEFWYQPPTSKSYYFYLQVFPDSNECTWTMIDYYKSLDNKRSNFYAKMIDTAKKYHLYVDKINTDYCNRTWIKIYKYI